MTVQKNCCHHPTSIISRRRLIHHVKCAIKFRDGVRLGNPLPVNAARLNYQANKELRHDRVEEAQELYKIAVGIGPLLGLSRCAECRRDFKLAPALLKAGIANAISCNDKDVPD